MTTSVSPQAPCRIEPRTWLITGATSGIGRALTVAALHRGDNVAALARHTEALDDLTAAHPDGLIVVHTDVRDAETVKAAVQRAVATFGRIDVVANIAGYGLFGAVEESTDAQARAIFDTNVFGVLNVLRATLPTLREQRGGHILQGSCYGQSAHPGAGLLAATQHAVEGLTGALAGEVKPLGIKVTLVEPGPTATSFLSNLDVATAMADYDQTVRVVQQALGDLPASAFESADRVAAAMLAAVDAEKPPLRLATGSAGASAIRAALNARLPDADPAVRPAHQEETLT
jgi:NAD(P)-dependent dehydrogenase (short-subunit alcohol dehydrogenase family)